MQWEYNVLSSQYVRFIYIELKKKHYFLKSTLFLFYKNPLYKNHET